MSERTEEKRQETLVLIAQVSLIIIGVILFVLSARSILKSDTLDKGMTVLIFTVVWLIFLRLAISVVLTFAKGPLMKTATEVYSVFLKTILLTPYHDLQFLTWLATGKDSKKG